MRATRADRRWLLVSGSLLTLALALSAQQPAKKAPAPQKAGASTPEDPNVSMFKYRLELRIGELQQGGAVKAAQELANMKATAIELSLLPLFRRDAIPALEAARNDTDKTVREEAALALKRIRDDTPYTKVSSSGHWVQVLRVKRGGDSGFAPRQSSDVLLEVNWKTTDPNIVSIDFMDGKSAGTNCAVLYQGASEALGAASGGESFRDPSEKMCGFAVPQEARGLKFRVKGYPVIDLKF